MEIHADWVFRWFSELARIWKLLTLYWKKRERGGGGEGYTNGKCADSMFGSSLKSFITAANVISAAAKWRTMQTRKNAFDMLTREVGDEDVTSHGMLSATARPTLSLTMSRPAFPSSSDPYTTTLHFVFSVTKNHQEKKTTANSASKRFWIIASKRYCKQ